MVLLFGWKTAIFMFIDFWIIHNNKNLPQPFLHAILNFLKTCSIVVAATNEAGFRVSTVSGMQSGQYILFNSCPSTLASKQRRQDTC